MNILFRVDASQQIGIGHMRRCLSLAAAFTDHGGDALFVVNDSKLGVEWIDQAGFRAVPLQACESWSEADVQRVLSTAEAGGCHVVVVDSDFEGETYLRRVREAGLFACAIEDLAPHPFPCQLVVNGDVHAGSLPYVSSSGDTQFLLGSQYTILRREFWEAPRSTARREISHVLIVFGGSDPFNLTPQVIHFVDRLPGSFRMTAILGPLCTNAVDVERSATRARHPVHLVRAPRLIRDLMLSADLAVSAGGQTLYELAWAGCPTVAIVTAVNQDDQVRVFEEHGFLISAGLAGEQEAVTRVADAVGRLMSDPERRLAMSIAGQSLIDGRGAIRVADRLMALFQKSDSVPHLTPGKRQRT